MMRDSGTGPRSFTRTMTHRPLCMLVTLTHVPRGSWRCAAVNWNMSYGSPLAVVLPWNCLPYQEALPTWYGLETLDFWGEFGAAPSDKARIAKIAVVLNNLRIVEKLLARTAPRANVLLVLVASPDSTVLNCMKGQGI